MAYGRQNARRIRLTEGRIEWRRPRRGGKGFHHRGTETQRKPMGAELKRNNDSAGPQLMPVNRFRSSFLKDAHSSALVSSY